MHKREKGNKGEDVACKYISSRGFEVIDRNYRKLWGEIDIIAKKDKGLHFFEVKSVTRPFSNVINGHKPEENVHGLKIRHIRKMVTTYLAEKHDGEDIDFHFHVICVFMNMEKRTARVKWIPEIIL